MLLTLSNEKLLELAMMCAVRNHQRNNQEGSVTIPDQLTGSKPLAGALVSRPAGRLSSHGLASAARMLRAVVVLQM